MHNIDIYLILTAEINVKRPHGQSGALGDILDGGTAIPLLAEKVLSGLDQSIKTAAAFFAFWDNYYQVQLAVHWLCSLSV